jgi:carbon-monoxide dehydrogenase medium subunit
MDLPIDCLLRPKTADEAVRMLADNPSAIPVAGGTDLSVQLRDGRRRERCLVDISNLDLAGIRLENNMLLIGAGTTMESIASSAEVRFAAPALACAASQVGAWPIQCRATLGGNLANASPAADTAPPLLVAEATLQTLSPKGARSIPITDFFRGPSQTELGEAEIIREVQVPVIGPQQWERFHKLGPRREQTISMVCLAFRTQQETDGRSSWVRIAVGSCSATPRRAKHAEAALAGQRLEPEIRRRSLRELQRDISPIDDLRAPASYRRLAIAVLLDRCLEEAQCQNG